MNHIAKLTEFFLEKEMHIGLLTLINTNIIFHFIKFIHFPLISTFF